MSDAIRPEHYNQNSPYEVIKIIEHFNLNFSKGNAIKYILRAGKKNDEVEDLEKAKQYLQFEIDRLNSLK